MDTLKIRFYPGVYGVKVTDETDHFYASFARDVRTVRFGYDFGTPEVTESIYQSVATLRDIRFYG